MARVLILSLVFRPDNVSTAQIMGDLALDLQSMGHEVSVITTVPHYNEDAEALAVQPLKPLWGKLLQHSSYRGIKVVHVWMPRKGRNLMLRISAWAGFHAVSILAGLFTSAKQDIIIAPSPPLSIGTVAWMLGRLHRCPFIYNVQEIYPDVAVNLGVLKNSKLIGLLKKLERFVYTKADALTVISQGMAERIRSKGVPEHKIRLIPNFVDTEDFYPLSKDNDFSRRYGLDAPFVVSYAGNMGKPQGLDTLIEAAHLLKYEKDIHFLMMGDGSERDMLIAHANRLGLRNMTFLTYQPYSVMSKAYASTDASFVSQARGTSNDGIPSKVYRIMACARPVIASTDEGSDLARLVTDTGGGFVIRPGDAAALANAIRDAFNNREAWLQKGMSARNAMIQEYSRPSVSERYHELILELTGTDV
ncbi:MAG: glycosyltransferase family 4 protein [Syntrophales bacterium]|nr:glycosyltransferase family 4 protein [Syntrophales bacterium]MDX9922927.1 glycosyltransferase family 4 protein [Syntrophales bacterium]